MAAGAFSDVFLLRSTEPTQKKEKKKKTDNLAVPGPRTNAQGSNRPFGRGPLTLTLKIKYRDHRDSQKMEYLGRQCGANQIPITKKA